MTRNEWEAWETRDLAAEERRQARLATARARRETHAPCEDPFCPWCVPFGQHLDPAIQQRRRQAWAQHDRQRDAARIQQLRGWEVEDASGFLNDLPSLRKAAGLSQSALGAKVGISRQSLNAIEAGRSVRRRRVVA